MELLLRADAVATIARDRADAPGLEGSGGTLNEPACPLRVLFLVSAHNGLSQRALIALRDLGHEVTVAVVDGAGAMEAAVRQHDPELIVCPFLKTMIPESIWSERRCLIVHPGPVGDRGPSSLDWAIELDARDWGVTVLEANAEADAGRVWASRSFPMRDAGKSSLYRHEVRTAAVAALHEALNRIAADGDGDNVCDPRGGLVVTGRARPLMTQAIRSIDWASHRTQDVVRKLRAAEGHPGVLDVIGGAEFYLFGAHEEGDLHGRPGDIIAQRSGAICRATSDGAVWITHLKRRDAANGDAFKLPATRALELAGRPCQAPEVTVAYDAPPPAGGTYRDISYEECAGVGYLRFDFYNGAMSTAQCERLRGAYIDARASDTQVIVLLGGSDYFSNGIHLGVIEAAEDPARESWRNLVAIDDLVREIIETDSKIVISALAGDTAAGGVPLALAADVVVARDDIVLNPYYQHMGGLYGSEYWTYLLPRRVGAAMSQRLTTAPFTSVGAHRAVSIGLLDATLGANADGFAARTRRLAGRLAGAADLTSRLDIKRRRRRYDEAVKPLQAYRDEELRRAYECFFGPDRSYHEARRRFVYKLGPVCAPQPADDLLARLAAATKHYERHVLAWYALGRWAEARAARETVVRCQQALGANLRGGSSETRERGIDVVVEPNGGDLAVRTSVVDGNPGLGR
jgi:putative two-component system hydrogenase maturation factor HypX/HoxX